MRKAVIADTGPLFAAVDPHDQYHRRALVEAQRLVDDGFEVIVAHPTVMECYTLVRYRLGVGPAFTWLEELLVGASLVNPTVNDYTDAAARIRRYPDQRITLFDATVAVLASRLRHPVWTYDHHFDAMRVRVWRPGVP